MHKYGRRGDGRQAGTIPKRTNGGVNDEVMSPSDFIKEIYLQLIDQGWTLESIDEMDFFYYLDLMVYRANKKEPKTAIDQVF
ncbi:hypothetical protein JCM15765_04190 [Paradesulfitobacterium aromaticivorans]